MIALAVFLVCLIPITILSVLLYRAKKKKQIVQTQELKDFITDLQTARVGFIRVDPGDLIFRSPRGR